MDGNQSGGQPPSPNQNTNITQGFGWGIVGILLGLSFFAIMFIILNYFGILSLSRLYPNLLGWLPQQSRSLYSTRQETATIPTPNVSFQPTSIPSLESCSIKEEGNPLVQDVQILKDGTIFGTFRGNIQTYTLNQSSSSATMEVISPRGDQTHTFTIKEEPGLVYDAIAQKDLTLSNLRRGLTVVISFNCFPNKGNLFRLTRIAVTGKL
ncbi:MAG: hypothetical protein HY429_00565 [Candidatus Levybacteria bacterium]|nr:hypothetical protein [Candidatus Levybacteria bacterium]